MIILLLIGHFWSYITYTIHARKYSWVLFFAHPPPPKKRKREGKKRSVKREECGCSGKIIAIFFPIAIANSE